MSDPAFALQTALHATLAADADLADLLAPAAVYDAAPRGAPHPYVSLGFWRVRADDASLVLGHEHRFTVAVRSRAGGRLEAQRIAARIETLLHDATLTLSGHRLINLRLIERITGEGRDRRSFEADLLFRAFTEPDA